MKILLPRALAVALICALDASPALSATPVSQGSKVAVPPPSIVQLDNNAKRSRALAKPVAPLAVLRLPTQAGKVSAVIAGKFVANAANSWIAKGDKRFSLCTPTQTLKVRCAPVVATRTMTDITVTGGNAPDGTPLVMFMPSQTTKRTPANVVRAVERFMGRLTKASATLNRQAVSYAPKPWDTALKVGNTASVIDAGSGGGCTYDDFGGMACEGGGAGGEGGGGGRGGERGFDPYQGGEWGGCYGACDYPAGNESGDPEPNTDQNGDPMPVVEVPGQREPDPYSGPVVVITGQRPDPIIIPIPNHAPLEIVPIAMPVGCYRGLRGLMACPPPPPGALPRPSNPFAIPSLGGKPIWSDIDWCKWIGYGCPKASEEDNKRAEEALRKAEKIHQCLAKAASMKEYCVQMSKFTLYPTENAIVCVEGAIKELEECLALAKGEQP